MASLTLQAPSYPGSKYLSTALAAFALPLSLPVSHVVSKGDFSPYLRANAIDRGLGAHERRRERSLAVGALQLLLYLREKRRGGRRPVLGTLRRVAARELGFSYLWAQLWPPGKWAGRRPPPHSALAAHPRQAAAGKEGFARTSRASS